MHSTLDPSITHEWSVPVLFRSLPSSLFLSLVDTIVQIKDSRSPIHPSLVAFSIRTSATLMLLAPGPINAAREFSISSAES